MSIVTASPEAAGLSPVAADVRTALDCLAENNSISVPDDTYCEILAQLDRQTVLLETIAAALAQTQPAPNYKGNLDRFHAFDWSRIGATVEQEDVDGVAAVLWHNNYYVRRSAANKFEPAIWFSRPIGKDEDGNNRYERLITFKRQATVEPLPDRVRQTVRRSD